MNISLTDIMEAHKFSSNNRKKLLNDKTCGCFYCLKIFKPNEITNWLMKNGGTALCPYCNVDSIIGESSGYPISIEFLTAMYKYWFNSNGTMN